MADSGSQLAHDRQESEEIPQTAQVLQFRPRDLPGGHPAAPKDRESELLDDLAQYEQTDRDEDLNDGHRMLMNVIAVLVVTALVGLGVWLADTIAVMERDQDCVLQGRQNCAPIEVPVATETRR